MSLKLSVLARECGVWRMKTLGTTINLNLVRNIIIYRISLVHRNTRTRPHIHARTHTHSYTCADTDTYSHTQTHTQNYHTHLHTHTHTHTGRQTLTYFIACSCIIYDDLSKPLSTKRLSNFGEASVLMTT